MKQSILKKDIKTNMFLNGETVSYCLMAFISMFCLFAFKQAFKLIFGLNAQISVAIAFVIAQIISYLLEKRFVFRKKVLSSNVKQVFLLIFRAAVNFGFYELSKFLFVNLLEIEIYFAWIVALALCFLFNYFFDRILLFDCAYDAQSVKYSKIYMCFYPNRYVVFSGIFTGICLFLIFIGLTCFPFGDFTLMRMDLYHQYGPLFAELYERVVNHQSLIYSWFSGGGSSFIGNYFNYLAGPLTGIIFLFDKADISIAITTIIFVKGVLSAVSFTAYLKYSKKSSNVFTALFGALYAFCAYFLAYYWNVMWLEGFMLLPIVTLGIERIIDKGKAGLYTAVLALLLISSYYVGFMTCIFSVIYFFAYMVLTGKSKAMPTNAERAKSTREKLTLKNLMKNRFFNRAVHFGVGSILAGAISAFALIPVFIILNSSSATSGDFPQNFKSYFDIFDFLTSHLAGLKTTIRSSGNDVLPNVYCGTLTAILLPLFVINKDIRFRDKLVYIVLLLFFLFSFDNNIMNYMWHAMHFPNDLPYRFSYMYSFILLIVGYISFSKIKSLTVKDVCFSSFLWLFFILVAQKMETEKMSEQSVYLSIAFTIIWCGFLYYFIANSKDKRFISFLAVIIVFLEIICADISAFQIGQTNSGYKENYNDYTQAVQKIHENDDGFYREELAELNTRMDPCYYSYNGMSNFSSMAYENYSRLQRSLGMFGNRINSYTYNPQTAVYNMMFNLKYIINNDDNFSPNKELYSYSFTTDDKKTDVYENKYFLPIAYTVPTEMKDWFVEEGDPFEIQSDYFYLATGYRDVFNKVDYLTTEFDGVTGEEVTQNGTYSFNIDDSADIKNVDVKLTPSKAGNLYVYVCADSGSISDINVSYGESVNIPNEIGSSHASILDAGYVDEGEEVNIKIDCQSTEEDESISQTNIDFYVYTLNHDVFEKGYNKLKSGSLNVTNHTETKIEGTVDVEENSYLYTSIPFDKGWKIYIDGKESETFSIANEAMLATAIKPGNHTVELKFTPRGVKEGIAVSLVGAVGFVLYTIFTKKHRLDKLD